MLVFTPNYQFQNSIIIFQKIYFWTFSKKYQLVNASLLPQVLQFSTIKSYLAAKEVNNTYSRWTLISPDTHSWKISWSTIQRSKYIAKNLMTHPMEKTIRGLIRKCPGEKKQFLEDLLSSTISTRARVPSNLNPEFLPDLYIEKGIFHIVHEKYLRLKMPPNGAQPAPYTPMFWCALSYELVEVSLFIFHLNK